ncbi:hypothetical protein GGR56DRAFT_623155, partial [Xylariaceae sp. FL0804]
KGVGWGGTAGLLACFACLSSAVAAATLDPFLQLPSVGFSCSLCFLDGDGRTARCPAPRPTTTTTTTMTTG